MKLVPRGLAALGATLALSAVAPLAGAASSASSVLITSFSYTTSAGTLSWSDPYQSFSVLALNAGGLLGAKSDYYETDDYGFVAIGATTSSSSGAGSTTTPQTFWATANTVSSTGAITNLPNQAEATAIQSGSFTLSGAGTVTFTVGYKLDVASPGGNASTDYGSALLAFDLGDGDGNSGGNRTDGLMSFAQGSGIGSRSGSFTLTVDLASGETGFYNLQGHALAFSNAWLLMTGGLFGMALLMRQRRRQDEL